MYARLAVKTGRVFQEITTLVDADVAARFAGVTLWIDPEGYALMYRRGPAGEKITSRFHRMILGVDDAAAALVDHINGDKLDNRRENLRIVSRQQNVWNSGMRSDNTSGYKGVTFKKATGKYIARIRHNGRRIHIGDFTDPAEAARAYDAKAMELRDNDTTLNFSPGVRGKPLVTDETETES